MQVETSNSQNKCEHEKGCENGQLVELRHFEEKLKGEFSIDLDLHDLSEKDFKMFINVSRDDLCYPNDLYFNFLCNKKQSQILRQNSRVFDFVSKKYNIQH